MVTKIIKPVAANIGVVSCVGIWTETYPVKWGNYFDFESGERCLNMWAENLEAWTIKNRVHEIECTIFCDGKNKMAFVTDGRVGPEWLHNELCITGRGWGSRELCEACCEFQGASTANRICGCEKPDEEPHITKYFMNYMQERYNVCRRCGRKFDMVKD